MGCRSWRQRHPSEELPLESGVARCTHLTALCIQALRLNPLAPPLVGGRFAIQITAMLTIAVRSQVDLTASIGHVTQLLWIDSFYLTQFATVLIALLESAIVHHLVRQGRNSLAIQIDNVFRVLLPLLMYPLCTVGLMTWAAIPSETVGIALVVSAVVLPILGGILQARRAFARFEASKRRLASALVVASERVSHELNGAIATSIPQSSVTLPLGRRARRPPRARYLCSTRRWALVPLLFHRPQNAGRCRAGEHRRAR